MSLAPLLAQLTTLRQYKHTIYSENAFGLSMKEKDKIKVAIEQEEGEVMNEVLTMLNIPTKDVK